MRHCLILAAVLSCFTPVGAFSQQWPSDAELKAAIAKLGEDTDAKGFTKFEVLYKNPRRATELLIATLEPIQRGQYLTGRHPQAVWNIRALRSLTGLDFRGPTKADLTEDEAHFLGHDPKTDEVEFSALGCPVTESGSRH